MAQDGVEQHGNGSGQHVRALDGAQESLGWWKQALDSTRGVGWHRMALDGMGEGWLTCTGIGRHTGARWMAQERVEWCRWGLDSVGAGRLWTVHAGVRWCEGHLTACVGGGWMVAVWH